MGDEIHFNYNIDSSWSIIKVIRNRVEALVMDKDPELAAACKMTASELVENAVKYGIINDFDFENVKKHIDDIRETDNPHDLYLKRLEILMKQKNVRQSQLGLYRIAYEGEFHLAYSYDKTDRV